MEEFYVARTRDWLNLAKDNGSMSCSYGVLDCIGLVPVHLERINVAPDLNTIIDLGAYCVAVGLCEDALFEYSQFMLSSSRILENHDFSEDGIVSYEDSDPASLYVSVNHDFRSFIVDAKRFLDLMESDIKSQSNQKGYEYWKSIQSGFFDDSLAYAFCYEMRNVIEHECGVISIVNIDEDLRLAGFAVNVSGPALKYRIKKIVRERLVAFAKSRVDEGLAPWLSVGAIVSEYTIQIQALFCLYLDMLTVVAEDAKEKYECACNSTPEHANCVVCMMDRSSYEMAGFPFVYVFGKPDRLDGIKRYKAKLLNSLNESISEK